MRKKLTLVLYLLFVDCIAYMLVVVPAFSFQISSSTTGYVRIASQAAVASMTAAQRSATLAAVAPLISGTSAGSVAVRMVASSVGWPALGIVGGMALAMLYYNSSQTAAIRAASAPQSYSVPGWTPPATINHMETCQSSSSFCSAIQSLGYSYSSNYNQFLSYPKQGSSCATGPTGWGYIGAGSIAPDTNTTLCFYAHQGGSPSTLGSVSTGTPTTASIQTYIGGLPSNDPSAVEMNTTAVGAQVSPTPADSTGSNPVDATGLATSVVPAATVQGTDLVLDPNAVAPTGTQTTTPPVTNTSTGTQTKTTTTATNPDGSVTQTSTETDTGTASPSCSAGNHETRTFGVILQAHMNLWQATGLLSALNLLKTLTWPSSPPSYNLTSSTFGNYTIDFSPWTGMLTAIRSIIIALAGFVAYRIVFVGSK